MNMADEYVERLGFKRVHKMGQGGEGRTKKIVVKFTLSKERKIVGRQLKRLVGTVYLLCKTAVPKGSS